MMHPFWNQLSFTASIRTLRSRPFCSSLPQLKEYKGVGEEEEEEEEEQQQQNAGHAGPPT